MDLYNFVQYQADKGFIIEDEKPLNDFGNLTVYDDNVLFPQFNYEFCQHVNKCKKKKYECLQIDCIKRRE